MNHTMRKLFLASSVFASFTLVSFYGLFTHRAVSQVTENAYNTYPQEFVDGYMTECQEGAVAGNMTEEQAQQLCGCMIDQFQAEYTITELREVIASAEDGGDELGDLIKVGEICAQQLNE